MPAVPAWATHRPAMPSEREVRRVSCDRPAAAADRLESTMRSVEQEDIRQTNSPQDIHESHAATVR